MVVPPRHRTEPDFTRLPQALGEGRRRPILEWLAVLYGAERAPEIYPEIERIVQVYRAHRLPQAEASTVSLDSGRFTERDVVLITYGDLLVETGRRRPLGVLSRFLDDQLHGVINTVHILPFFPYSSDRGFSIIDYEEVDPQLGTWADLETLSRSYRLMFDGVFNHVSSKSRWFQRFLNARPGYEDFFVAFERPDAIPEADLKRILRPRTSPLLTPFHTLRGLRYVWTTFSADQIDLNFKNERVLYRVLETLLLYVRHGAELVRLDAVTYVWRELGTACANLGETHALVRLLRAVLDASAPEVALVTETNVPHAENVAYFGDGSDEAQMVYNFALPPLVLHAFLTGDGSHLTRWAAHLEYPRGAATFFNFLSSHDGIGLLGARGILPREAFDEMLGRCRAHGGLVSNRRSEDGSETPYELNITWWSALNRDDAGEPLDLQIGRFLASRSVALALRGVPGVYLPSLFGARNDSAAVKNGDGARSINRRTVSWTVLEGWLADPRSRQARVLDGFRRLLSVRIAHPAFHPGAGQVVLDLGPEVFALVRTPDGAPPVLAVTNLTAEPRALRVPGIGPDQSTWVDLLGGVATTAGAGGLELSLGPYAIAWLARLEG
ncbi:MAG: alpha-amylase family glycosyl hydrolase [Deferrisomatales bacterium]|nr:alpha-amylase family glycosyl hydrolase [Deferrisomatales bacterium]